MFENIGGKIKGLSVAIFLIVAIGSVILGLSMLEVTDGVSLILSLIGVLIAWISSWFLYGFGEIIDKLCEIEMNTRRIEKNTGIVDGQYAKQFNRDFERINKIKDLYSKGLITEEEYKNSISNLQ